MLFLPLFIISSTGHSSAPPTSSVYFITLTWVLLGSAIAHGLGWRLEHWTIQAAGRANSNAALLRLLGSLKMTGVLDKFKM